MTPTIVSKTETPTFSRDQLEYLQRTFCRPITPTYPATLEELRMLQGRVAVVHHIQHLIEAEDRKRK